jgi:NAD(P)H dehydrogenase (quinone)
MTRVKIVFYSMYGHIYRMAEAVAEGVREVPGAEAVLLQVPELVSAEALAKSGADKAREAFAHVPVATPDDLVDADAVIFGTPTRFGNMCAQMRNFLDQTGAVWVQGKLIGKVGSVFASSATQHGGQESTLLSTHITLLHHGMVVAGIPFSAPDLKGVDEVSGGSPYGATTIVGDGKRQPSERELRLARFQGAHVARLAARLSSGHS